VSWQGREVGTRRQLAEGGGGRGICYLADELSGLSGVAALELSRTHHDGVDAHLREHQLALHTTRAYTTKAHTTKAHATKAHATKAHATEAHATKEHEEQATPQHLKALQATGHRFASPSHKSQVT